MTATRILLLVVIALAPAAARAQDLPPAPPHAQALTLRDALRRAHDHAPAVLAAIARETASRAQIDITRSALWPTLSTSVSGSASLSQSTSSSAPIAVGSGGTQAASTYPSTLFGLTGSVNANWLLWDFGRTDEATRVARFEASASAQDLADARRAAEQAVGAAFFGVLADQQIVATDAALVEQRRAEAQITQGLVEVGSHPPIEETRARVTLAAAELDLRVSQGTLAADTAALAAALAIDPTTQVTVVAPSELTVNDDFATAANDAVRARPDVRAAQLRLDESNGNVRLAQAAWMPTLSASAALTGRLNESITTHACQDIQGIDFSMLPGTIAITHTPSCASGATTGTETTANGSATGTVSAGIVFSAPLIDESISVRVHAAEAQRDAQQASLEQLVLSVRTAAVQAAISVRNAAAALAQGEELARQAAANLEQARGRYETGATTYLELVDAEAADASARITVVRLRAASDLAKLQLLAATGRLDGYAH